MNNRNKIVHNILKEQQEFKESEFQEQQEYCTGTLDLL